MVEGQVMKMSEYPMGTIIELPEWGLYRKRSDSWTRIDGVDGWDDDFDKSSLKVIDERQENGLEIIIISVPWGLAEALIEMCYDLWCDNDYRGEIGEGNESILKQAIKEWEDKKQLKWLAEEELRRKNTDRQVAELKKKLEG
jgi:hypothetical protein